MQPQPKLPQVVAAALRPERTAHDRQRELLEERRAVAFST